MNNLERDYKVYKHTSPCGKVYIGITFDINDRWRNGKGYKNQFFSKAIKKYGWNNIKHEILFSGLSRKEAEQKEVELIALYKSNDPKHGYNCTVGGEGSNGYKYTDEQRKAISERQKGKTLSEEHKKNIGKANVGKHKLSKEHLLKLQNSRHYNFEPWNKNKSIKTKEIIQFDLNGKELKRFVSAHSAYKETGATHILECCKGRRKTDKGFVWKFAD